MKIKKIIVFIFALNGFSAFAGTMGPTCGTSDTAPCNTSGWELGAKALYLTEDYANSPWKTGQSIINTITGTQQSPFALEGYGWGFFAEGAYRIGNDRKFNLNLYYLDNKHKVEGVIPNSGYRNIQQDNKWLAVNLEVSQVIPVTDSDGIRGYAGVQYAALSKERSLFRAFTVPETPINGVINAKNDGSFNGAGLRFGVDLTYNLPCNLISGFSVYTNAAAEVLVGSSKSRLFVVTEPGFLLDDIYDRTVEVAVVPEFDIKAGVNYKYPTAWGDLNFDLGWMWFDYVSATVERADAESADVIFYGAYFGLKWVGNFA